MTKIRFSIMIIVFCLILAACKPAETPVTPTAPLPPTETNVPPTVTPVPPTETPTGPQFTLEVIGPDGSKTLTQDDLKNMPSTEGMAGIKSSTGRIFPPVPVKGVALKDLVTLVSKFDSTMGVNIEAEDGYAITFSYDQVINGAFIQYDPATGDELKSPLPVTAMLAYEQEGKPLDPKENGSLRLAVSSAEKKQVVDGHWSVKWVSKIEVKPLGEAWSLHMEGAIVDDLDRATFESCGAPGCHGVTWKDDKAQEWAGVPLWLLLGRVDDEIKHEGPSYNQSLAEAGYSIDIVASDGYSVTLESTRTNQNNNLIVANLVNGNPLPDKYFPLRLVGSDAQKNEMVGMIAEIIAHISPISTETSATTPAPATNVPVTETAGEKPEFVISGLVEQELSLFGKDLRGMEVVKITAEHPKQGKQDYEGVRLNALLDLAGVKPEAKKLVFSSDDGYSVELDISKAKSCSDCLVAFTEELCKFNLVMPGMESSLWVKSIVGIEVK